MILLQSRVFHLFALTNNEIGIDVAAYRAELLAEKEAALASVSGSVAKRA